MGLALQHQLLTKNMPYRLAYGCNGTIVACMGVTNHFLVEFILPTPYEMEPIHGTANVAPNKRLARIWDLGGEVIILLTKQSK